MRVPVIFAFLIFMLPGSNINPSAVTGLHSNYFLASPHIQKKGSLKLIHANRACTFIANPSLSEEDKTLICEDAEDEDVNDLSPKKYKPVAGFYPIPFCLSAVGIRHNGSNTLPFPWRHVSHRYIVQRALRI